MSDVVVQALNQLASQFGVVVDWTSENVLPYLQDLMNRIISYKLCISCIWLVISLVCIIISSAILFHVAANLRNHKVSIFTETFFDDVELTCRGWVAMIVGSAALFTFFLVAVYSIQTIVRIKYIPEIVILNMIQGLM